jgi:hypothetical protein
MRAAEKVRSATPLLRGSKHGWLAELLELAWGCFILKGKAYRKFGSLKSSGVIKFNRTIVVSDLRFFCFVLFCFVAVSTRHGFPVPFRVILSHVIATGRLWWKDENIFRVNKTCRHFYRTLLSPKSPLLLQRTRMIHSSPYSAVKLCWAVRLGVAWRLCDLPSFHMQASAEIKKCNGWQGEQINRNMHRNG